MMTNLGCTQETTSDTNALNNTQVSDQSGASLVSPLPSSTSHDTDISAKSLTEEDLALMSSDKAAAIRAKLERWKAAQAASNNVSSDESTNDETSSFLGSYPVAVVRPAPQPPVVETPVVETPVVETPVVET
ncbi:MAG TPA: hypothetical protein DDW29_00840, partial [Gammaproteobacteria bacterium]|nr:hypothetical protein [Gammaproteobacteria bacterium]